MADQALLSAEKLTALTGLTDRRHRQIAKAGYFPPPYRGQYQQGPTILGMFRYYREKSETVAQLRAKVIEETFRDKKRENDLAEKLVVRKADVLMEFTRAYQPIKEIISRKLENEFPAAAANLDVAQIRPLVRALADELCAEWAGVIAQLKLL